MNMTAKPTTVWEAIEAMSDSAAVLAEWRQLAGNDFENFQSFLYTNDRKALDYPCAQSRPCGCRHEIVRHANGRLAAACRCTPAECKSIPLKQADLLLYQISCQDIADAARRAFGLEDSYHGVDPFMHEVDVFDAGEIGLKKYPVKFLCCHSQGIMLSVIDSLLHRSGSFLLITPTAQGHSDLIRSKLRRNGCDIIALSETVKIVDWQTFEAIHNIEPILAGIGKTGTGAARTEKLVQDIHQKISAVESGFHDVKKEVVAWRTDYREVQDAKARLEKMQSDGLMKFIAKVDGKSFHILCGIIACGDVAKASRALKMGDSTIRDVIRSWKKLGPSYAVMSDLVRWRKRVGGKYTVPFNDAVLYEKDTTAGNESVFSELLDAVLSMTESSWPDICAELESILKKQLGK
jgi:hypothetical protein